MEGGRMESRAYRISKEERKRRGVVGEYRDINAFSTKYTRRF